MRNPQSTSTEKQSFHLPMPTLCLGSIALAGSKPEIITNNWHIESQRTARLSGSLQDITSPYVEAAQKITPQNNGKNRRFGFRKQKTGEHSYVHEWVQNNRQRYTRFTVEYTTNDSFNSPTRLKAETFFDQPPKENVTPNQHVWIDMDRNKAHSIHFGNRKDNVHRYDNCIHFRDDGVEYQSDSYLGAGLHESIDTRIVRTYNPLSDKFMSIKHFLDPLSSSPSVPQAPMAPNRVIGDTKKALALIPVEDEVPLY